MEEEDRSDQWPESWVWLRQPAQGTYAVSNTDRPAIERLL